MRIVHLSFSDRAGGAAIAAYRVHHGLRDRGHESFMVVADKRTNEPEIIDLTQNPIRKYWRYAQSMGDRGLMRVLGRGGLRGSGNSMSIMPSRIWPEIEKLNPDVLHLHWVNRGIISIPEIAQIPIPAFWTLHDLWPVSGGFHYLGDLHGFEEPSAFGRLQVRLKNAAYAKKPIHFVGPSTWMTNCIESSGLIHKGSAQTVPNGLDTKLFDWQPLRRNADREELNLPQNRQLLLAGAVQMDSNNRKGLDLLIAALAHLEEKPAIVIFGNQNEEFRKQLPGCDIYALGEIREEAKLAQVYNACDCFVIPSREDNLPNVIAEGLACGLPCVGFHIGGLPDMIKHEETGYLAEAFDVKDLAQGIQQTLKQRDALSPAARRFAVDHYAIELCAKNHEALYESKIVGLQRQAA